MKNYNKQLVNNTTHGIALVMAALGCLSLAGCATAQKNQSVDAKGNAVQTTNDGSSDDPLEGYNRVMFKVNDLVDQAIMQPVAMGYRKIIPHPIRMGVRNFLHNLRTPVNAANNLLQG